VARVCCVIIGPMTSRFQPFRLLRPFLILALICVGSYWLNPEPWHHLSMSTKLLFGGSLLVVVVLLLTLRNRMFLRIDEQGVTIQYIAGAPRFYAWSAIDSVRIFKVNFLMIPMTSSLHLRMKSGSVASIPGFFDESAQEIAEKINFFKRQGPNA
jgi:Bacterial PH domain